VFHVILQEMPLQADVFGLLVDQCVQRVSDGALVVLPYGGGSSDGGFEDIPHDWLRCIPSLVASDAE
jgi:hypothetical protein